MLIAFSHHFAGCFLHNGMTCPQIPQGFVDQYIDSRLCADTTNININVARIIDAFGVDLANLLEAHAHRHGADKWTRAQRRAFANDFDNLLVVDDSTSQSKSDQAPHEWLPPNKGYWCEYGKRWERVKDKYGLRYSDQERIALNRLAETC